jgi:hypothetical protein
MLARALDEPTKRGTWTMDLDFDAFAKTGGTMTASNGHSNGVED